MIPIENHRPVLGGVLIAAVLAGLSGVFAGGFVQAAFAGQPAAATASSGIAGNGEQEDTPTVEVPEDRQKIIGLRTAKAEYRHIRRTIKTVGRVDYDERLLATVAPKYEGWIEKLQVDFTGKHVRKGESLAEVYSPELFATQQEFLAVLKWRAPENGADRSATAELLRRDTEMIVEAARQRLRLWDITDEQIAEIEKQGLPLRTLTLTSPVDGYVIRKEALLGMRFLPGEKLFDIADLSTVWILADVYEYELPFIAPGGTAKIRLTSLPGRVFTARTEYVDPVLSGETRTAKVRFSLANPGGLLKPQMLTNVEMTVDLGRRLVIPEDAVIDTGVRQVVYVDRGEEQFEPREVTTGVRADGTVEVLKGLKPGQRVVSSAAFLVDSEAKLKGIVK